MNDDDLKQRFRELKARDAKNAPSFDALTAKRPRRVSPLILLAPTLAAAAVLVVWCGAARKASAPPPVAFDSPPPTPTQAHAPAPLPLDFLLETTPIHVSLDSDPTEGLVP
jgi:hypothetical protein